MTAGVASIAVSKVTKRFGYHRALAEVELSLESGHLCALLGANGAGKSTMLGILSTLMRPSSGALSYRGHDGESFEHAVLRREIGVLAHEPMVYTQLNAIENLRFWGGLYQVDSLESRIEELLALVELDSKAQERPAGTYSRGMTQRLALARAMLHDPSILLLDEPFAGLDQTGSKALGDLLGNARKARRLVVVVTHDLEAIAGHADHVVVLGRGRVRHEEHRDSGFSYAELRDLYQRFSE